ncbi:MAG: LacI family DNA-binding transcriptional regulator [Christensenella sp.]|uniref:LacI family DNA-binding transcriptional regulator n=1 Tax=Christensenella sp. TaxID=1935934 RepID=UPI002B2180E3|nr:LacI family DNA-binding transcriptional regulator [Christensenella sp.]MEA5002993.1 LacI family DNA-binding transcriptional regulator [Christensenella sp.]
MRNKVTIYDVADRLGISTATVNRAINNKTCVSEKTRQLVQQTAEEMGYRPSKTASSLKRNPKKIAVLFPRTVHGFLSEVERGVNKAFEDLEDYGVYGEIFKATTGDHAHYIEKLREIANANYDGIVILPDFDESSVSSVVRELNQETDTVYATVTSDLLDSERLFSVQNNGVAAGKMAAELLSYMIPDKGRPVALVTGQLSSQVHLKTVEGFLSDLDSYGFHFAGVFEHHDDQQEARDLVEVMLKEIPDLGGIYFSSANSVTFCCHLRELGRANDMAIIASDVFPDIVKLMEEHVINATIFQNPFSQGRLAVQYLYEYMVEGRKFEEDVVLLDPQIVLRSNLPQFSKVLKQMKDDVIL